MNPSGEFEEVIHRNFSMAHAEKAIAIAAPLLLEAVDHASWAFRRCLGETDDQENVYVAPFWLYHHVMEQVDGIQVLVESACSTAALPLLRAAYEASLQLEFMHQEPREFTRRSSLWFASHLRRKVEVLNRLDPSTPSGMEFEAAWRDQFGHYDIPLDILESQRANLKSILGLPTLADFNAELSKRSKSPWYAAYGGPANLRDLASILGRLAEYETLYRYWSSAVHGANADLYMVTIAGRGASFRLVRDPEGLPQAASFALSILLRCTGLMIENYRAGEFTTSWYTDEIKEGWEELTKMKIETKYLPRPTI